MKMYRKAWLTVMAGAAVSCACKALTMTTTRVGGLSTSSSFVVRNSFSSSPRRSGLATTSNNAKLRHQLLQRNLFSNLFGGGGVQQSSAINYSGLDFPGNELGQMAMDGKVVVMSERFPELQAATFAGGCFWGLELAFQRVPGVLYTAVGYTQGPEATPTYGQVCSGMTKHTEAVLVYYDPKECSYSDLLNTFFDRVDPTTVNGQGNDFGTQYRTGVYYHTPEQEEVAKAKFEQIKGNYRKPIASECEPAKLFWPAEKYHQQYLEKGGRFGMPQSTGKGCTDKIRCYG